MININFYKNGLEVSGHSLYDDIGKDIVCAGVSAIIMGSLNWFKDNDIIESCDGYIKLIINKDNYHNELNLLKLIYIQLDAMNHSKYKKHLKINIIDQNIDMKG